MKIIQILDAESPNDVKEEAALLDLIFKEWGWQSEIFISGDEKGRVKPIKLAPNEKDVLLWHFCGSQPDKAILEHPGERNAVILHEFIPHQYHKHYDQEFIDSYRSAENSLVSQLSSCEIAIGHSRAACDRLVELGAKRVRQVPVPVDFSVLDQKSDRFSEGMLTDGTKNILFCGEVDPESGVTDLIKTFWYFRKFIAAGEEWRLLVNGRQDRCIGCFNDIAHAFLHFSIPQDWIVFTGELDEEQLRSYYLSADVYVSFDSGDLDGAALLRAVHFGVPVVASVGGAAADILADSDLIIDDLIHSAAAEIIGRVVNDGEWRAKVLASQKKRLEQFGRNTISFLLKSIFSRFED